MNQQKKYTTVYINAASVKTGTFGTSALNTGAECHENSKTIIQGLARVSLKKKG